MNNAHSAKQIIATILLIILATICLVVGWVMVQTVVFRYVYFRPIPEMHDWGGNATSGQPLKAYGRGIYDEHGNRVVFQGVNFGNWMINEGWMSTFGTVKRGADGLPESVNNEGVIESYEENYHCETVELLEQRFGKQKADELFAAYQDSYITEEDFVNVKNIGFNSIRLPVYYGNFLDKTADGKYVLKDNAFAKLDWFLEQCKANDLYAIIDMHGALGGQSGYEHSGTRSKDFWTNETYQQVMADLWAAIATRYMTERADLSQAIGAYDLLNEPVDRDVSFTSAEQIAVMDKLYRAIRNDAGDKDHLIAIEFCWTNSSCVTPDRHGWDNVIYECHPYNFNQGVLSNDLYYVGQDFLQSFSAYNVPYLMGEFTFFDAEEEWGKWLNEWDKRGHSWTVWSYKITTPGWWDNSWGVYVYPMNLTDNKTKVDLKTASYEEILADWSAQKTSEYYTTTGVLYKAMTSYFGK